VLLERTTYAVYCRDFRSIKCAGIAGGLAAIEHKWGYETAFRAKGQAAIGGRGRPGSSGQSLMNVHQGRGLAQDKYGRPVRDQRSSFGVVVAGGRPSSILRVWSISATSNVSDGKAVR